MITVLTHFSNLMIPLILFYVVATGFLARQDVYSDFVRGAREGVRTVIRILPTMVGLMVAIGVLRASGFLNFLGRFLGILTKPFGLPADVMPLLFVKMFSSSAATGLVLDLFKNHGTDSFTGLFVSIVMSCTETIFYTMSVYFMAAKVTKTRYTLVGALLATFAGTVASVLLAAAMSVM